MQILNADAFKTKMQEFVKNESSRNLIFSEDLKNMVHLASDKNDTLLLSKMIEKFCAQSKEARFGNFVFGPPIMRLLHHLKDPESALALFKQEELNGFFDQLASYQVLFDLLFESGRHEDVLETFEVIQTRQVQGGRFPKHAVVLTLASCYKLNTPASFEYATKVYKEASDSGHVIMRKGISFFACLALRQGSSNVALEVLSNVKQQNYLTIRTLKALAFAHLKRFDDSLAILKSLAALDSPTTEKQTFPKSLIEELSILFQENKNKELQKDFEKVTEFLEKHGHISQNTIDDILCTEIQQTVRTENDRFRSNDFNQSRGQQYSNSNYPRRDREYRQQQPRDFAPRRPGLHELN